MKVYSYVRWLSERQSVGDSERRQEAMALEPCTRAGLNLSETRFTVQGTERLEGSESTGQFAALLNGGNIIDQGS